MLALGGNERFRAVADAHDRLIEELGRLRTIEGRRIGRETEWATLQRLLVHADGLGISADIAQAIAAIREGRQLLDEPDPVAPILADIAAQLRLEVRKSAEALFTDQRAALDELQSSEEWRKLDSSFQESLVKDSELLPADIPDISTEQLLLGALDSFPLSSWRDRVSLVPTRLDQARRNAAKRLEPESVTVRLPSAMIKTQGDLEKYVGELRALVQSHLDDDETVIL